jgi:hypothetical protein
MVATIDIQSGQQEVDAKDLTESTEAQAMLVPQATSYSGNNSATIDFPSIDDTTDVVQGSFENSDSMPRSPKGTLHDCFHLH